MSKTVAKEIVYVLVPGVIIAVGGLVGQRISRSVTSAALARLRSLSMAPVIAYALSVLAGVGSSQPRDRSELRLPQGRWNSRSWRLP